MKLSDLDINDVGIFSNGKIFRVTNRYDEDRVSGGTEIMYLENQDREWNDTRYSSYVWDRENPIVKKLGTCSVETKIVVEFE